MYLICLHAKVAIKIQVVAVIPISYFSLDHASNSHDTRGVRSFNKVVLKDPS